MAKKYSDEYIGQVAAGKASLPADPGQAKYVQRLARNYAPGISRSQARGHARTKFEAPISKIKQERGIARNATIAKPRLPVAQRKKVSLPHVKPLYRKSDTEKKQPIGKVINARSKESLHKQLDRLPDSAGILLHVKDVRTGEDIRAIGDGKGGTVNVGKLRKSIASKISSGSSWDEAFDEAVYDSADLYEGDTSEGADGFPAAPTNYVAYIIF